MEGLLGDYAHLLISIVTILLQLQQLLVSKFARYPEFQKYHERTNINGYNIWQLVEIMDLARY